MGFNKFYEILKGAEFFIFDVSVFHSFSPINLTVSIPRQVVFAFGGCSLSERLKL